jgi:deoxyribonuclease V
MRPEEVVALQKNLAGRVIRRSSFTGICRVAGIDACYRQGEVRAAVAVLSYPELELVEHAVARRHTAFAYRPGLLTFREGPAVLEAIRKLAAMPDLMIFDGHGLAHPRRFGIACHMGVWLGIPSIGCAKTPLFGRYVEPGQARGNYTFLKEQMETIGAVVRTRSSVKPVFVSIGHLIDLETGITWVLNCCRGFRLPETTRWAHRLASF